MQPQKNPAESGVEVAHRRNVTHQSWATSLPYLIRDDRAQPYLCRPQLSSSGFPKNIAALEQALRSRGEVPRSEFAAGYR
jgi:hypothetical protein